MLVDRPVIPAPRRRRIQVWDTGTDIGRGGATGAIGTALVRRGLWRVQQACIPHIPMSNVSQSRPLITWVTPLDHVFKLYLPMLSKYHS